MFTFFYKNKVQNFGQILDWDQRSQPITDMKKKLDWLSFILQFKNQNKSKIYIFYKSGLLGKKIILKIYRWADLLGGLACLLVGILGCTYAHFFPKNSNLESMIELILQITLIINGLFLSRVGVVYICSPLQARPTETVGQERRILTLREANPGPLDGLRFMLTTKLGINVGHLSITKYILHPAANAESCKIHHCQTFQRPRVEVQSQWGSSLQSVKICYICLIWVLKWSR